MASFYGGSSSAPGSGASWHEEEEQEQARRPTANNGAASDYTAQAKEEELGGGARAVAAPVAAPVPAAAAPAATAAAAPTLRRRPRARPRAQRTLRAVSFADLPAPPLARPVAAAAAAAVPPSLHRALAGWRAFRGDAPTEAAQDRAIAHGFAPDARYDGPLLCLRGRAALAVHAYAQRVLLGSAFCAGAFGGVDPFAGAAAAAAGEDGVGAEAPVPLTAAQHHQHHQPQRDGSDENEPQDDNNNDNPASDGSADDPSAAAIAAALRMLPPPPVHIEVVSVDVAPSPLFGQEAAPGGARLDDDGVSGAPAPPPAATGSAAVTYRASYRLPLRPPPWPLSALFPSAVSVWATDVLHLRAAAVAAPGPGAEAAPLSGGAPPITHAEITAVHSRPHNCPTVVPGFVRRIFGATSTWFLGEVLRW